MTEQETFNKLRRSDYRTVREKVWADYVIDHRSLWFVDYLIHRYGRLEEILAEHSWSYEDFIIEINKSP